MPTAKPCGQCPMIVEETRWHRRLLKWRPLCFRCAISGRYVDPADHCNARLSDLRRAQEQCIAARAALGDTDSNVLIARHDSGPLPYGRRIELWHLTGTGTLWRYSDGEEEPQECFPAPPVAAD